MLRFIVCLSVLICSASAWAHNCPLPLNTVDYEVGVSASTSTLWIGGQWTDAGGRDWQISGKWQHVDVGVQCNRGCCAVKQAMMLKAAKKYIDHSMLSDAVSVGGKTTCTYLVPGGYKVMLIQG